MPDIAALYRCVDAFVAGLAAAGVGDVGLCPGSRSTPLALAFARHGAMRVWTHLDERSAGFFALGMAKAGRRPVALLCTSGTAAANFAAAVVEAYNSHLPLLVCTADRPPELHQVGANQTIEQQGIYGRNVRWALDFPVPDATDATARYFAVMAGRAVRAALAPPGGPVHLNFPFREPLVSADPLPAPERRPVPALAESLRLPARRAPGHAQIDALDEAIRRARRGLIVCGEQQDSDFPLAIARLAAAAQFPVLADPLSGVRCGPQPTCHVVDCYDALLRDTAFAEDVAPDLVLRFGAAPTSKPLLQYLGRHAAAMQALVAAGGWADPSLAASAALEADPMLTCRLLASALEGHAPVAMAAAWTARWRDANAAARRALDGAVAAMDRPFEGRVFTELAALLPDGALLFAGNSMPVRDLDSFFPAGARRISFLANRGASGIDGVVSSALGAAAAHDGPTVLVIGDLSFYHDMNGLLAAKRHALNLTIVLINNDGGGIFSFLPQADQPEHFEQLFGTPHGLDFAPVATLYGARFCRPQRWEEFGAAVRQGLTAGGLHIVELRTERAENVRQHRALWPRVAAAVRELA